MFFRFCICVASISLLCQAALPWSSADALTEKQLHIQRWFSSLTFLQQSDSCWDGWGDAVNDLNCDGNSCIRYEISGLAYAAAVLASKTPAYTDVSESILYDAIMRMITKPVWQYIELFDDFQSQPSYPDPVAYKNIMYSGHLAQMIALYESLTGNMTFSTEGWQFSWGKNSDYPEPIPYSSRLLFQAIYNQTSVYEGALGGVPCEPDSIFVICNNYPMNAFLLYDQLHNTTFADVAVAAWQNTVTTHGVNRLPDVDGADNNYFNLDYLIHPLGTWEPIASVGSDMWALSWMSTWWDYTNATSSASSTATVLQDAYRSVLNSSRWVRSPANITSGTPAQAHIHPGELGNKIFPFSDAITTSFFPMIYKQFNVETGSAAEDNAERLLEEVYAYFDANYGMRLDSNGDGVVDSFMYNTARDNCTATVDAAVEGARCETGDYSVWVTSNMVIGTLLPSPAENPDYLRNLFRGKPLFLKHKDKPKVKEVAYPHVMVSQAEFLGISNNSPRGSPPVSKPASARGGGTADVTSPGSAHNTSSCACPTAGQLHFTLVPGDNAPSQAHTVLLSSGCDANSVHMSSSGSPCTESAAQLDIFLQQCTTVTLNGEDFVDYRAIASSTVGGAAYIELNAPGWSTANAGPNRNSALSFVMNWCA